MNCTGDDISDSVVPSGNTSFAGVYVEDNQWIYSQMNHHYLWREDLPDSISCDYLLDPVSFFKSLLSHRDRFSYCEHNEHYSGVTRGIDDILYPTSVLCDSIYSVDQHRIGYLCYRSYNDIEELTPVMRRFYEAKVTDMILDLRYNGGGYISTCQYLCSSVVPENAYGKLFEYLQYNDVVTQERIKRGQEGTYSYYFKTATDGRPTLGPQLYGIRLNRLFVLTSRNTASASESTIVCLKPYMKVITIGEQTTGKGVGMETLYDRRYKYQLVPITFQYYNSQGETVPEEGLMPDILVEGGLEVSRSLIGNREELLLKEALSLILSDR